MAYGVPKQDANLMVCIAKHESNYRADAINTKRNRNHTVDRGLFQINDVNVTMCNVDKQELFDAVKNTQCAVKIYNKQGLEAWSTYRICAKEKHENKVHSISIVDR